MKFVSTRIITADVQRLVGFYEIVTRVSAVWANELFAEIPTPAATLAIGSDQTVPCSVPDPPNPRPTAARLWSSSSMTSTPNTSGSASSSPRS